MWKPGTELLYSFRKSHSGTFFGSVGSFTFMFFAILQFSTFVLTCIACWLCGLCASLRSFLYITRPLSCLFDASTFHIVLALSLFILFASYVWSIKLFISSFINFPFHSCWENKVPTRDGADRKFVPAVRTASAGSVCCPHRVRICCTLLWLRPRCTAIPKFYPLTAMAICAPSPEALCFS